LTPAPADPDPLLGRALLAVDDLQEGDEIWLEEDPTGRLLVHLAAGSERVPPGVRTFRLQVSSTGDIAFGPTDDLLSAPFLAQRGRASM
jgi:hypothetical protein